MVEGSAMVLQLGLQAVQQLGVDGRAHFAAQDLLGALDGERGDLVAQDVARLGRFLLRLGLRLGNDLGGFVGGLGLGFLDDLQRQAFGSGQTRSGVVARGAKLGLDALIGTGEFAAGLVGCQMYFIVNPTKIRNTIIWMIRVAVMLTFLPRKPLSGCGAPVPLRWSRSHRRLQTAWRITSAGWPTGPGTGSTW
jgi:hypothetical protein